MLDSIDEHEADRVVTLFGRLSPEAGSSRSRIEHVEHVSRGSVYVNSPPDRHGSIFFGTTVSQHRGTEDTEAPGFRENKKNSVCSVPAQKMCSDSSGGSIHAACSMVTWKPSASSWRT